MKNEQKNSETKPSPKERFDLEINCNNDNTSGTVIIQQSSKSSSRHIRAFHHDKTKRHPEHSNDKKNPYHLETIQHGNSVATTKTRVSHHHAHHQLAIAVLNCHWDSPKLLIK
jgi:hypothetical protein